MKPSKIATQFAAFILTATQAVFSAEVLKIDADMAASRAIEFSALSRSAASVLAQAKSLVAVADASRLPEISLEAGIARQNSVPEYGIPISGPGAPPSVLYPSIESTGQAGVKVEQLLYSGGAVKAQQASARSQVDAKTAEVHVVHAELALAARLSYWQAVAEQSALEAANAHARRAERLLEDANAMRQAGMAVDADVFAAQSRQALAQVQVIRRHAALDNALQQLKSFLQIDFDMELELAHVQESSVPKLEDVSGLVDEAKYSRAELRVLDSYGEAMEQQAASVDGSRRPKVAAMAQWNLLRPNQRYFPIKDEWNDSWNISLVASWKVFDGGRARSHAASIRHERSALSAQRDEQERHVILEVQTTWRNLQAARATVDASQLALRAATSREQTSNERYDAGLAPISEVLDAQAELAEAELSVVRSRAETSMALARLNRAVGR